MRLKKIDKQQQLKQFLFCIAEGCTSFEAAEKAGFEHHERDIAREMHNPEFLPLVATAIRHRLGAVMAVKAMKVAEQMLNSKNTSPRIRWDIAKTLLAAGAGFVPPKAKELEGPQQDIAQMTGQDIMQLRQSLEQEMASRANNAKMIEHQPETLNFLD